MQITLQQIINEVNKEKMIRKIIEKYRKDLIDPCCLYDNNELTERLITQLENKNLNEIEVIDHQEIKQDENMATWKFETEDKTYSFTIEAGDNDDALEKAYNKYGSQVYDMWYSLV